MLFTILLAGYYFYDNTNNNNTKNILVSSEYIDETQTFIDCYNSYNEDFILSDDYNEIVNKLTEHSGVYSITLKEISDNYTVINYNEEHEFYGESIIKLAYAIYIYDYLIDNQDEFDTVLKYNSNFYVTGSGVIRYMDLSNISFTIRELLYYMVEDSDNIAFYMLIDYFGKDDARAYWNEFGTNLTFTGWDNFGLISGSDATIYLNRLYEIISTNDTYYDDLIQSSQKAAKNSILNETLNETMYFKYGGANYCYHEIAIVDDDANPYMITVLTELSSVDRFTLLPEVATIVENLHNMYWTEKYQYCSVL